MFTCCRKIEISWKYKRTNADKMLSAVVGLIIRPSINSIIPKLTTQLCGWVCWPSIYFNVSLVCVGVKKTISFRWHLLCVCRSGGQIIVGYSREKGWFFFFTNLCHIYILHYTHIRCINYYKYGKKDHGWGGGPPLCVCVYNNRYCYC